MAKAAVVQKAVKRAVGFKSRFELNRRGYLDFIDTRPPGALRPDYSAMWFIYRLVRKHKPKVVLEFGSGCSTVVIAQALADNGAGHVTSVDSQQDWAEVTRSTIPEELTSYCEVVYAPAVEEQYRGEAVFRHVDAPALLPDLVYLDGPVLNSRVKAAVDLVYLEDQLPDGFVLAVEGRMANVEFLRRHFNRNYRVSWHRFSTTTVFQLSG